MKHIITQQFNVCNFLHEKEQLAERNRYTQSLESQLAQRPGADDVLVLRQELVHAQTLMDQLTQDQEKEKKKLEEDHNALKEEHQR